LTKDWKIESILAQISRFSGLSQKSIEKGSVATLISFGSLFEDDKRERLNISFFISNGIVKLRYETIMNALVGTGRYS